MIVKVPLIVKLTMRPRFNAQARTLWKDSAVKEVKKSSDVCLVAHSCTAKKAMSRSPNTPAEEVTTNKNIIFITL